MREHDLNALYRGSSMVVEPEQTQSDASMDDCFVLMSMALDGLLDHEERARLDSRIAADPVLAETWRQWCKVDVAFAEAPRQQPASGFTNRFEARLEKKIARERMRQHIVMGVVATVVWSVVLVGAGLLLWFLLTNQGTLMASVARETAYYGSAIGIAASALQSTASATFRAPQSIVIAVAYAMATVGLLYVWLRFLRRMTYEHQVVEQGVYQSGVGAGREEK